MAIETTLAENACILLPSEGEIGFADTVKGVKTSAPLHSIVSTAGANGLEPYAYLRDRSPNGRKPKPLKKERFLSNARRMSRNFRPGTVISLGSWVLTAAVDTSFNSRYFEAMLPINTTRCRQGRTYAPLTSVGEE
ncbi:MAG: hypothetical protein M3O06_08595 [Pseudomonadota bacterium]|nr:hypothetical protein [Pseudomonadota bacterium]